MTSRKFIFLQSGCLVLWLSFSTVKSQDDFKLSSPNKDGWINPDVAFAPSPPPRHGADMDIAECLKRNDEWSQKYSECETSLQTMTFHGCGEEEKDNEKSVVASPSDLSSQENTGAKASLQRFIHLLLEVSNLNSEEVQPVNNAQLKFSISSEDLYTLRRFVSEGDMKSIPIRKLDDILGTVLVKPFFTLPEFNFVDALPSFHVGSFFLSVLLPAVWFLSILFITKDIRKSFLWLFPVSFLTSFITTAKQMFEEAQMKQYEQMKKYPDLPGNCKRGSTFLGIFSTTDAECYKFLKAHHMDPDLGITSFKVLTRMFGEIMAAIMGHFGEGTFDFISRFEDMGLFSKAVLLPIAFSLLTAFTIVLFLAITGGTGRLPFFLGSFTFQSTAKPDSPHQLGAGATAAPPTAEALPPTGNITVNINGQVPANVHELLTSLTRGPLPSNQHSAATLQDSFGGGDAQSNFHSSHFHRPHTGLATKKTHRQFSQLSSKYKSGIKSNSKIIVKRARNLSL